MTIHNHTLGFPRIGLRRELKKAQESYWAGSISRAELLSTGCELRSRHWEQQKQAGVELVPVGDFSWYDRIPTERLCVNPDCGLKTRGWTETRQALENRVKAAQNLRNSQ